MDIVIPLGYRDLSIIQDTIHLCSLYVSDCRRIYVVASTQTLSELSELKTPANVVRINEKILNIDIESILGYQAERTGYIRQMLLKLLAFQYIPTLSEPYLVIDADMHFQRPISFSESWMPYTESHSHHWNHFWDHCLRCHPSLEPIVKNGHNITGIHHHMVFHAQFLKQMIELIESYHELSFEKVFLRSIDPFHYYDYVASEYELYFIYMNRYHSSHIQFIPLYYTKTLDPLIPETYVFYWIVKHWYLRHFHPSFFSVYLSV